MPQHLLFSIWTPESRWSRNVFWYYFHLCPTEKFPAVSHYWGTLLIWRHDAKLLRVTPSTRHLLMTGRKLDVYWTSNNDVYLTPKKTRPDINQWLGGNSTFTGHRTMMFTGHQRRLYQTGIDTTLTGIARMTYTYVKTRQTLAGD